MPVRHGGRQAPLLKPCPLPFGSGGADGGKGNPTNSDEAMKNGSDRKQGKRSEGGKGPLKLPVIGRESQGFVVVGIHLPLGAKEHETVFLHSSDRGLAGMVFNDILLQLSLRGNGLAHALHLLHWPGDGTETVLRSDVVNPGLLGIHDDQ